MTAGVQVKPTEALTRRTARKFAISNFLILAVVLLAFIVVLNVWSYMYSYGHIDARSNYQVQTFIDEHQSAEDHTYGLSKSFIPVLYIKTADDELLNLHPTDDIPPADIERLLEYPAPFGDSTAEVDGRSYRIHREHRDAAIVEGPTTYQVDEVRLFRNITEETALRRNLISMSIATYLVSLVAMAPVGYFMAKRSMVPIRDAWERQRQFSADASHKLKTPLAVILANTEMALRHPEHRIADEAPALEASLAHAYKMRNTLSDLLTLTQVEDSMLDHMDTVVDLGDVVEQLYEGLGQLAVQQGVGLAVDTQEGALVLGDCDRLEELVTVFVENAIQYTAAGGEVSVDCRPEGKWAVLTVRDTGMGMDPETVAHVFDRFYRSEQARQVNPQGTGLGLPKAEWIASRHGGRIDIASERGRGTTVRVLLPRAGA